MGMLSVMRGEVDAPEDVRFRAQCVWCKSKDYAVAHNVRIYTSVDTFTITLIFCSADHSDKFVETHELSCVYDSIYSYCRRSVESEGYTMKRVESIFDVRRVNVDIDIDGTLRGFMVNCRRRENVKREKASD